MIIGMNNASISSTYAQLAARMATSRQSAKSEADAFSIDVSIDVTVVDEVQDKPRTIDDVKKEFYDFLNSLQVAPGLAGANPSVSVTEGAFQRMLDEPEFMQQMKDLCVRDLCDPAWNSMPAGARPTGSHTTITDGSNGQEPYLASSWGSAYDDKMKGAKSNSFWSHRSDKKKQADKAAQEKSRERKEMLEMLQERAAVRKQALETRYGEDVGPAPVATPYSLFSEMFSSSAGALG